MPSLILYRVKNCLNCSMILWFHRTGPLGTETIATNSAKLFRLNKNIITRKWFLWYPVETFLITLTKASFTNLVNLTGSVLANQRVLLLAPPAAVHRRYNAIVRAVLWGTRRGISERLPGSMSQRCYWVSKDLSANKIMINDVVVSIDILLRLRWGSVAVRMFWKPGSGFANMWKSGYFLTRQRSL